MPVLIGIGSIDVIVGIAGLFIEDPVELSYEVYERTKGHGKGVTGYRPKPTLALSLAMAPLPGGGALTWAGRF